jgi:hypothetical protein
MPSHLRKYSQGYDLERWVERDCALAGFLEVLHDLAARLNHREFIESTASEKILVNLVANILDAEGSLEDYVFGVHPPLDFHKLDSPGAMAPVCEAAAILIVWRYRAMEAAG